MKADELLFWLSARCQGSWQQFRAAVEELHSVEADFESNAITMPGDDAFPLHQELRLDLERLAHVEFFARECENGWRVAPPVLAAHRLDDSVRAVLCGARSPALCERVLRSAKKLRYETSDCYGIPKVFRFVADNTATLGEAAKQAGIHFQPDAPLTILSHLPPLVRPSKRAAGAKLPDGADWSITQLQIDRDKVRWKKAGRHDVQNTRYGVFRFHIYFQRDRYFVRWAGVTYEQLRADAIYLLLHHEHRHVFRYNADHRVVSLPAVCRPPRVLERALVLCSGLPPVFASETSCLTYSDVPVEIARLAAQLLLQPLT